MLHSKFQPNIPCPSGGKGDIMSFAVFSMGDHLGLSFRLNFLILKPCSLVMQHVKFENHGCSGFRELAILNRLKSQSRQKFF